MFELKKIEEEKEEKKFEWKQELVGGGSRGGEIFD